MSCHYQHSLITNDVLSAVGTSDADIQSAIHRLEYEIFKPQLPEMPKYPELGIQLGNATVVVIGECEYKQFDRDLQAVLIQRAWNRKYGFA